MDKFLHIIKKIIPKKFFKKLQPFYHFFMSWLAAFIYQFPSEKLIVIGATGTTGKTTVVYLTAKILEAAGYKTGFTSTALFNDGKNEWLNDKKMTMVGRFFTQKILRDMVRNQCRYAIIETTSEGIRQFRHRFINYDILIFTGLYPEHIDSHGSFENYRDAKGRLFHHLKNCKIKYVDEKKFVCKTNTGIKKLDLNRVKKTVILNADDDNIDYFFDFWSERKILFARDLLNIDNVIKAKADTIIDYGGIIISDSGISFRARGVEIKMHLLGEFNAVNAAAAFCVGLSQNISSEIIAKGLGKITGIPGRLEIINFNLPLAARNKINFTVIVDYAFEPNALLKLYETVEKLPHQKIIHVLGSAGGGRDFARRPKLGKIAGEKADFIVITNEDPYDDDPAMIIQQVAAGAESAGKVENINLFKITDRRLAIKKALRLAGKQDIILITGKGCEQAICVANGEKAPWDDRRVAAEEIERLEIRE